MIYLLNYLALVVIFAHGSYACCCAETTSVFPRVELTTQQMNTLTIFADYLDSLPCDERLECMLNLTQPIIQLTDSQIVALAQRFKGSFRNPVDIAECGEQVQEKYQPLRRRRRQTAGTSVCRAVVENNQKLFVAYNTDGELVYIPQPTSANGFQMAQYFYESTCLDTECVGSTCSCSTELIPSSTCVVYLIRDGTGTFSEQTVMTRLCQAFN